MKNSIKVLFLAAEAEPFIKVGGLADVAGSLPAALQRLKTNPAELVTLDVRLALPFHSGIKISGFDLTHRGEVFIPHRGHNEAMEVFETHYRGVPVYLLKHPFFTKETAVYSRDSEIDQKKYALFSLACLKLSSLLGWYPDIVHANDWHTALTLYVTQNQIMSLGRKRSKKVITIHNLPYMGGMALNTLSEFKIPVTENRVLPGWAQTQFLPLGLSAADAIIPVSPTYAREILRAESGCGLDEFLRGRKSVITGIINGIDVDTWDPSSDPLLVEKFSSDDFSGRKTNKLALLKLVNLKEDPSIPLLAMVGRIDHQKGLDIAFSAIREIKEQDWFFILLGMGDPLLEKEAYELQAIFPDRVRVIIKYDSALSRLIYGGADIFMMPSRYEPCGIAQMIAMRYGCIPVVHATGGLKDTVIEKKTGFLYNNNKPQELANKLDRVIDIYSNQLEWQAMQKRAMKADFSWARSARKYLAIYRSLIS